MEGIVYAEKTNRHLVLDWRDDDWCHDKTEETSEYFTIVGNSEYSREKFFEYYERNKSSLNVAPRDWKGKVTDVEYDTYIYRKNLQFGRGNQILYKIATKGIVDFPHEVVVYPSSGNRSWSWNSLSKIKLSVPMETLVIRTLRQHDISLRQYNVVHLRGGSKNWLGGHVGQKKLREKINSKFPTKDSYFDFLYKKYKEFDTSLPLIILSDNRAIADEWIDRYECGILLDDTHNFRFSKCGTHKIKPNEMGGLSKRTLNMETLRDFTIMIGAKSLSHDGLSYFSNMGSSFIKKNIMFANDLKLLTKH
jgi:hypothetical protein